MLLLSACVLFLWVDAHQCCLAQPKLDNARWLRGIYFINPEDKEVKETIKNARKKLETPVAPAMLCKELKDKQEM